MEPHHYNHQNWPYATTAIMTSLVDALPTDMDTRMRYPWLRERITTAGVRAKIGYHNDCFTLGGGAWDHYMPSNSHWPTHLEVTPTRTVDGEMPWDKGQSRRSTNAPSEGGSDAFQPQIRVCSTDGRGCRGW